MRQAWIEKRRAIRPRVIGASQEGLIKINRLQAGQSLPLVVEPGLQGVSLPGWAESHLEFIHTNLLQYGGILFRGFGAGTQESFERILKAISIQLMNYMEGATPRTQLGNQIYTSTEYPSDQSIALHNELTYILSWPMKILFLCVTPAEAGGETPIADVGNVFKRIAPRTRDKFADRGWMLVRNYGKGLSLPWQSTFHTTKRSEVEEYCRAADIGFEWRDNDRFRTWQTRAAIATHPVTNQEVWFNHIAFWHISSLEPKVRAVLLSEFKEEDLPYNTYYGDGGSIEPSVVEEIREAYRQETVSFPWQKGDLLLLDNMLVAHGRNPYSGPRRVLVAMGEPYTRL